MGDLVSGDDGLVGTPTWFGSDANPLFGVVHVPRGGEVRGGVVLCPPLGKEHIDTYVGLKLLAQHLCAAGFVVLRFDYLGTGDSARTQGADTAIDDYLDSIETAVGHLRDGGVEDVSLVGLRAGALLAASASVRIDGLHSMVLWDPVFEGRRYLREQRVLYKMTVGEDVVEVDTEPILGLALSKTAAAQLKALKMPEALSPGMDVLLLVRPERMADAPVTRMAAQPDCRLQAAEGQAEFVEPMSFVVEIPEATVTTVANWLDTSMPRTPHGFEAMTKSRAIVATSTDGREVVEVIERIGPHGLFAIRTQLADGRADVPVLLTHSTACQHRIGPGRVWTECSREAARLGFAALRYDRRGTGDTGIATTEFPRIYSEASKHDVIAAAEATGVPPSRLMMSGVCSGAWNSAYVAVRHGAKVVVMVNAILYSWRNVEAGPEKLIGMTPRNPGEEPLPEPRTAWNLTKKALKRWLPYRVWLILGKLGLTQVPEILFKELRRSNVTTDLVLSPNDLEWFTGQRGERALNRLSDQNWSPQVTPAPTGDHPLLQRDIQNLTRRRVLQVAVDTFAPILAERDGGQSVDTDSSPSNKPIAWMD